MIKNFDDQFRKRGVNFIAGTDEAGRGPLAGPVVAAAVILPPDFYDNRINDSKKLSIKLRTELYDVICRNALTYAVTSVNQNKIDEMNILRASLAAMKISVDKLKIKPDLILIDGNKTFDCELEVVTIVKGDSKSLVIASASIIAKVVRDRIMINLARKYPQYDWQSNKGYPTPKHIEAVLKFGPTPFHRRSFLNKIFKRNNRLDMLFAD